MRGRICLLAIVAASAAVHVLPVLPERAVVGWLGAGLVVMSCVAVVAGMYGRGPPATIGQQWARRPRLRAFAAAALVLWVAYAAFASTVWRAQVRLDDRLAPGNENKVSRVVLRIATLPRLSSDRRQFEADVLSSRPAGVPSRILVSWTAGKWGGPYRRTNGPPADFPELVPGQVWRMALTLKTPHGERNPHGFDYEGHVFSRGIRAIGSVRGTPRYLRDEPWAGLSVVAERARHRVREAMRPHLEGRRYGAVLLALAIGDQDSVPSVDAHTSREVSGLPKALILLENQKSPKNSLHK